MAPPPPELVNSPFKDRPNSPASHAIFSSPPAAPHSQSSSPSQSSRREPLPPPLPGSPLPGPPLPGSPAQSLHSNNSASQQPSPGAQRLIPRLDLDRAGFFVQLLNQDDDNNKSELDLEDLAGDLPSPDGSELGLDDVDLGLPDNEPPVIEPPGFDFDEDLEPQPGDDPDDDPGADNEPDYAAFDEPDVIRNAYVMSTRLFKRVTFGLLTRL
ncbi:hypothetical protein FRC06_004710 [Ceratobasidium sp. 370]|nr:hypothetical protein FRC06_004710 [Ceratobasidium sp. 370]